MNFSKYFIKSYIVKPKSNRVFNNKSSTTKVKTVKSIDKVFLITIIILSLFGALMVYSGSVLVAVKLGYTPYHYFLRQLIWVLIGLIALYITYRIDYRLISKLSLPGLLISIFLLVLVLIVNSDQEIKRWIDLGAFDLQPSELTKVTLLVYLSTLLSKQREVKEVNKKNLIKHFKKDLLPFISILGIVLFLIVIEPDMDTTIMLALTSFILYFISGNDAVHTIGSVITAIISIIGIGIATLTAGYRMSRFQNFFDFWKNGYISDPYNTGFQFRQILVAVASGGLTGVGFSQSRQKYHYLGDTAFSDTIFAIFAEEFGLIGCILIIAIFIFIFLKGYSIAMKAPDKLGFLMAIGITTWITLQAFLHIGANVGLIPINGNTLPFMSYGGSSTIINLAAIGILLNISSYQIKRGDNLKGINVVNDKYSLRNIKRKR